MTVQLGLAIGPALIVAAVVRRTVRGVRVGRVFERSLETGPADGGWPEVTAALRELLPELGATTGEVAVALLPPIARAKVLWLPRLRRRDLRALVSRAAGRYFAGAGDHVVADAVPLGGGGRGGLCRCLAACAPAGVVDVISAAVAESGLACEKITAAAPACMAGTIALAPGTRRGRHVVVLDGPGWREGVAVSHGAPLLLESWDWAPPEQVPALAQRLAAAAFDAQAPVVWPGANGGERLAGNGGAPPSGNGDERPAAKSNSSLGPAGPAALAAWGAALARPEHPVLLPNDLRDARERRVVRAGIRLATAAAAAMILAAVLHLVGLQRELAAVAAARQDFAQEARAALEVQRLVRGIAERLGAVAALDARPRWTPRVVALARALPDSTYLTSLATDGDALRVQGVAPSAPAAVRALQGSERLANVRLLTSVRADEGADLERFDLVLGGDSTGSRPPGRSQVYQ